ncbi:hypothetical protein S245_070034 [Arachis hypogaea]
MACLNFDCECFYGILNLLRYSNIFEIQLAEHEHELIEMNYNSDKLRQSYNELLEFKIVLQKVSSCLTNLEATLDAGLRHRNKALASSVVKRTLPPPPEDANGAEATKSNGEEGGEQMETS